jgi:adenylate cyclase
MAYRQRRFDQAIAVLEAVSPNGADPAVLKFIDRCRALVASPPPPEWDGVFTALTK